MIRPYLFGALLFSLVCSAQSEVPKKLIGQWKLESYERDGETYPPKNIHYVIFREGGRMFRIPAEEINLAKSRKSQQVAISENGKMTTIAADGTNVDLGSASIEEGKLHLRAADGEHHLIYIRE